MCMPETSAGGFVGQELLLYEMVREIVSVFITIVIAEFCHQFGWCVADMERNREIPRLLHVLECCIDGEIRRIAFRTGGKIDCCLCQWYATFGHTDFRDGIETCIGKEKSIGICQTDVF